MFSFGFRSSLARLAWSPARVHASRPGERSSEPLKPIAPLAVADAPLMRLCCGSDRLIAPRPAYCWNNWVFGQKPRFSLAYAIYTYIYRQTKQRSTRKGGNSGLEQEYKDLCAIRLSEKQQGRIRGRSGADG